MNKEVFLQELRRGLAGLPQEDIEERLSFYDEMIDDRMEDGLSESDAIAEVGAVDEIVEQTLADIPLTKLVKENIKPKRSLRAWEIVLLVLGFPLWFPLLIAAAVIMLALYIVVWALIVSLWAVEVALWAAALGAIAMAAVYLVRGNVMQAVMMLGAGLFIAGVSIFMFYGCVEATKGILKLTKKAAVRIKSMFLRKENA